MKKQHNIRASATQRFDGTMQHQHWTAQRFQQTSQHRHRTAIRRNQTSQRIENCTTKQSTKKSLKQHTPLKGLLIELSLFRLNRIYHLYACKRCLCRLTRHQ